MNATNLLSQGSGCQMNNPILKHCGLCFEVFFYKYKVLLTAYWKAAVGLTVTLVSLARDQGSGEFERQLHLLQPITTFYFYIYNLEINPCDRTSPSVLLKIGERPGQICRDIRRARVIPPSQHDRQRCACY